MNRTSRIVAAVVLGAALGGCGVLTPDVNQPRLAYELRNDGRRIADWTLAQSDAKSIFEGQFSLAYAMSRDPAGTSDGWVRVVEKLRSGWPGLDEQSRAWVLTRMIRSPAENWGANRDPNWRELFLRLRPPERDGEELAVWREAGEEHGLLEQRRSWGMQRGGMQRGHSE